MTINNQDAETGPAPSQDEAQGNRRVQSWNELQDELFWESWNAELGRYRSRCAYRGLSSSKYPLATTLMRLGGRYELLERHLLRNFRKYAHRSMVERDSLWHWLALAKHYGLPSRLLDWTYSPLVALHFATANIEHFEEDGAVWVVNYVRVHNLLPPPLRRLLEAEGANVFTTEMLSVAHPKLEDLANLSPTPLVLFLEPPSVDDRIVNQHGLFSVMSEPTVTLNEWLEERPHLWRKIIIPAELKWEIRDKLDQANITERVLFPGLDGLSRWLTRHYSPRNRFHPPNPEPNPPPL